MQEHGERGKPVELRVYSPREAVQEIFSTLLRNIPEKLVVPRNKFDNLPVPIVEFNKDFGEIATLICKGVYFKDPVFPVGPVIVALGEISDPAQLSERGDTLIFVKPDRYPPEGEVARSYLTENLRPIVLDGVLMSRGRVFELERSRILGLRIGLVRDERCKYTAGGDLISVGGYISVDKMQENDTWPLDPRSWPEEIAEMGEITDSFIIRAAQKISKEIGIEVKALPPNPAQ